LNIEIILCRHGETEFNREGRIQGTLDSPLTDRGRAESTRLGIALREWLPFIDLWLVSPQGRARESSRLIRENHGLQRPLPPEEIEEAAREINCGSYEGKTAEELDQKILSRLRNESDFPYPDGESILDVMARSEGVLDRMIKRAKHTHSTNPAQENFRIMLVSHGNFNRCFGAVLSKLGADFALKVYQSNTGLNRFLSRDDGRTFKILTWNDISHAHGLEEQFTNLGTG